MRFLVWLKSTSIYFFSKNEVKKRMWIRTQKVWV